MPRPRRSTQSTSLSPGQASYVLERLIADRRISPGEVSRYLGDVHREISSLEERLNSLRGVHGGSYARPSAGGGAAAPARGRRGRPPGRRGRPPGRPRGSGAAAAGAAPAAEGAKKRRGRPPGSGKKRAGGGGAGGGGGKRATLTPEQLASRQLQGRYLGLIRQIPANKRGQYQKTAKEKGREAAIKEMQGALGK